MTQSESEGVYPTPAGWRRYVVREIASDEPYSCVAGPFGSSISSRYFTDDGIPVIRGSNLKDDLTRFVSDEFVFLSETKAQEFVPQQVQADDLVFTCWGTIGQVGLVPRDGPHEKYIISNKQLKLRVNKHIADPLFCFYYFSSPAYVEYIKSRGIGGAVPGINLGILKSLAISLPEKNIQERVVQILTTYDDLIENNRRRMAKLEEAARLLYQEWFVRLRFPGHEHTRIVNGVPEGWRLTTLGNQIELRYGKALKSDERIDGPYPVYGSSGIVGTHAKTFVSGPGIIVGRKGNVGSVFWSNIGYWPIDTVFYIAPEQSSLYTYYALRNMQFISTDVAVPGLNRSFAHSKPYLVPPDSSLASFHEVVTPIHSQLLVLQQMSEKLRAARDLLLPRLMSGEIAV